MDYGLYIFLYRVRIKPERKWCWLQIYAGIISLYMVSQCRQIIPVLGVGECLVLFYIYFHYQICFNVFRYEIRF